jgi:hypothetical protein
MWVMEQFNNFYQGFGWNKDLLVPIIPSFHGIIIIII